MAHWVKVSTLEDFQASFRCFIYDGTNIAIFKKGDCEFYAIDNECTHVAVPLLEGKLCDYELECPRHGARFDIRTGKNLCLPAVTPVQSYPLKIEDAVLYIDVEDC